MGPRLLRRMRSHPRRRKSRSLAVTDRERPRRNPTPRRLVLSCIPTLPVQAHLRLAGELDGVGLGRLFRVVVPRKILPSLRPGHSPVSDLLFLRLLSALKS